MSGSGVWIVTPRSGTPYRVTLAPDGDGWSATVEREGERWTFALAPGAGGERAWAGDRPLRWRHDRAAGRLTLNGTPHVLTVESEAAHHRADGARSAAPARARDVRAPMPGLVVAVLAREGDRVAAGQAVMVVEAMKMENEIGAPSDGVVAKVSVRPGEAVEKEAFLFRIEPAP
jgi:biotin carboxyl carrier protein